MATSTMTSKGQTTIPKEIRDRLGMKAGDRMTFTLMPNGMVIMRVRTRALRSSPVCCTEKGARPFLLFDCRVDAGYRHQCARALSRA